MNKKAITRLVSDKKIKDSLFGVNDLETIGSESISKLLKKNKITNVEFLDEAITPSALATRNETITHRYLKFSEPTDEEWEKQDYECVFDKEFFNSFNKNKALRNNYKDDTRGDVIEVPPTSYANYIELVGAPNVTLDGYDSLEEAVQAALEKNPEYAPTTRKEYSHKLVAANILADRSIENGFVNNNKGKGFTLSFWTIFDNQFKVENRADFPLISFIGVNEKKYYNSEDAENDVDYCLANTTLQIFEDFRIEYKDVYKNEYIRKYRMIDNKFFRRIMYRAWKQWMHVVIRFTDDDIDIFINGAKASPYETIKGKRFMDGRGMTDGLYDQRPTVTQFLNSEDTGCFLSTSIDGKTASRGCWYDDIIFYNEALSDDEIADIYISQVDAQTE